MHLSLLANLRRSGLNAMNLKAEDSLLSVILAQAQDDVVIVTRNGMSIRFASDTIRPRQRAAGGMKGITLMPRDSVAAMDVVPFDSEESRLLIASRKGFGKLSLLRHYRQQKRGGKGLITLKLTPKNGKVTAAQVVQAELEAYLVTDQAQVINIPLGEVRQTGRNTQGVTLAKLDSGDSVSAIRAVGPRRTPAAKLDRPVDEAEDNGNGAGEFENGTGDLEATVELTDEQDTSETKTEGEDRAEE